MLKKKINVLLIILSILLITVIPVYGDSDITSITQEELEIEKTNILNAPDRVEASPTTQKVTVNKEDINFRSYNINGHNYFMLRDIAYIFKETEAQFEVDWDVEKFAISLTTNEPYSGEGVGFNMIKPHIRETGLKSSATIYKNEKEINLLGYTIYGNTYFKIRDLGDEFNIDVSWDGINKIVVLKSDNITIDEDITKHTTEAQKQEMREYMLNLINVAREERGLVKLKLDDTLTEIAEYKSADLEETGVFSHDGSYGTHRDLMAMFDHTYTYTGENIAMGQLSAEMLFNSWWGSEGHRKNMMRPEFRNIGIGFVDKEYNIRGLHNVPNDLKDEVAYNEALDLYVHEGWSYYAAQIFGN